MNSGEIERGIHFTQLVNDIVRADCGVLNIRSRLAIEIESFLEVECDDRRPCEFQKEISQGADANLTGDGLGVRRRQCRISLNYFFASLGIQRLEQISCLQTM